MGFQQGLWVFGLLFETRPVTAGAPAETAFAAQADTEGAQLPIVFHTQIFVHVNRESFGSIRHFPLLIRLDPLLSHRF